MKVTAVLVIHKDIAKQIQDGANPLQLIRGVKDLRDVEALIKSQQVIKESEDCLKTLGKALLTGLAEQLAKEPKITSNVKITLSVEEVDGD